VWRFEKSELGMQSPRLWTWEAREKLLLIARLSFAFLLSLLDPGYEPLRLWLLRRYDHRTGRRVPRVRAPLYRLRGALSRMSQQYPPSFEALGPPRVLRVRMTLLEGRGCSSLPDQEDCCNLCQPFLAVLTPSLLGFFLSLPHPL
jgi:hypothetical protein